LTDSIDVNAVIRPSRLLPSGRHPGVARQQSLGGPFYTGWIRSSETSQQWIPGSVPGLRTHGAAL